MLSQQLMYKLSMLLLLLWPVTSFAIYKWTDENGKVHYTQSPPPDGNAEEKTFQLPPQSVNEAARKKSAKQKETADSLQEDRHKIAAEQKKSQEELAKQHADCERAKQVLASYQRPRVNAVEANGQLRRLGEEERQATLAKAQQYEKELCH